MKDIKFIHIPKTAGSSIESVGSAWGYEWGWHDPKMKPYSNVNNFNKNNRMVNFAEKVVVNKFFRWHHIPLQFLHVNPYEGKYLFTVIRNPYDRMVSEFYCGGSGYPNPYATEQQFNLWIQYHISNWRKISEFAHYIPQNLYTHDAEGKQTVNAIIKYEELPNSFNDFIKEHDSRNIVLNLRHNASRFPKRFGVQNLDSQTIQLINTEYSKEFELYGYEKRSL